LNYLLELFINSCYFLFFVDMASVTPLSQLKEIWMAIIVGQEFFPQLDHGLRAAFMNTPMGNADWLLNPLSLDALGNFVPQPSFADVAELSPVILSNDASAAERGLLLTEYGFRLRSHDFAEKAKLAINGPFSELMQFIINPNI
jgi:hypothetical protein